MAIALVVAAALGLAGLGYLRLERLGRTALLPAGLRALAWAALGLLLLNPGCPVPPETRTPVVLLDGSLSMTAAGGRWAEALAVARGSGEVRLFGDPEVRLDSVPRAGASRAAPALAAARAAGRPVIVVTDGELHDSLEAAAMLGGVGVRLFPRVHGPAAAVQAVRGPARVAQRDTLRLRAEVRAAGMAGPAAAALVVLNGGRTLARQAVRVDNGLTVVELSLPARSLPEGDHALVVALADSLDPERRDDSRLHLVTVTPTPGVVLAASPGDWDARFLFQSLRSVTELPVEGYVELVRGQWRRMSDLAPVDQAQVRQAVSRADLAVVRGAAGLIGAAGRAVLEWPSPATEEEGPEGDWYLTPAGGPTAAALAGLPVDSFPPAMARAVPAAGDWVGLTAQAGRRGAPRPALAGTAGSGRRRVVIGAQGLWRWAFRGGSSEQAYRALVATTVDWLLAGQDTVRGRARPVQAVAPNGRPLAFAWTGSGAAEPLAIRLRNEAGETGDTLRFDGAGRAILRLAPGVYRYTLEGGGRGTIAVEEYSEEFFPEPVVVAEAQPAALESTRRQSVRERWWLFAFAVAAWCGEWVVRRRLGLR